METYSLTIFHPVLSTTQMGTFGSRKAFLLFPRLRKQARSHLPLVASSWSSLHSHSHHRVVDLLTRLKSVLGLTSLSLASSLISMVSTLAAQPREMSNGASLNSRHMPMMKALAVPNPSPGQRPNVFQRVPRTRLDHAPLLPLNSADTPIFRLSSSHFALASTSASGGGMIFVWDGPTTAVKQVSAEGTSLRLSPTGSGPACLSANAS